MNTSNNLFALKALSPIDGRYSNQTQELIAYFSEFGLIKYRVIMEIEYLLSISELTPLNIKLTNEQKEKINAIIINFDEKDATEIKNIEKTTNHDVKAVEYFLKEKLINVLTTNQLEFIHFGLTSQDINNTAIPLSIKHALEKVIIPTINNLITQLIKQSADWQYISMLARTHGQPASPTTLGKEIYVFVERLIKQKEILENIAIEGKFGGATGNFNAHLVAFPAINWIEFANEFLLNMGIKRQQTTTQIEHYDQLANIFDTMARINTILIDYCKDIWSYISFDYFKQKLKEGEIGSSAMPHKVNPIDFENAEGNLGIANALFNFLSGKLPISRLQRDLTDSTVLRNVSIPFGHTLIALKSITKGNEKLIINIQSIEEDLDKNWAVVAEAIQTILRTIGYPKPYEALKNLTRTHSAITKETIYEFINTLTIDDDIKHRLHQITPSNYIGYQIENYKK